METVYDKGFEARKIYYSKGVGVLSTHSKALEGYPFGSVVPYVIDRDGQPVILISTLAQHTKNIAENSKVCLTIVEENTRHAQSHSRLSYLGIAEQVENNNVASRYIRYYPSAKRFFDTHDFNFYKIYFTKARFIGGFGKIFWIERDEFLKENSLSEEDELSVLEHMNKDHQSSMRKYFTKYKKIEIGENEVLTMVGIDKEGFDIRYKSNIYRFNAPEEMDSLQKIREILTQMSNLN